MSDGHKTSDPSDTVGEMVANKCERDLNQLEPAFQQPESWWGNGVVVWTL